MSDSEDEEFESADEDEGSDDSTTFTANPGSKFTNIFDEVSAMADCDEFKRTVEHFTQKHYSEVQDSNIIETPLPDEIREPVVAGKFEHIKVVDAERKGDKDHPPDSTAISKSSPDVSSASVTCSGEIVGMGLEANGDRPAQYAVTPENNSAEKQVNSAVKSDICDSVWAADDGWEIESLPDIPADDILVGEASDCKNEPRSGDTKFSTESGSSAIELSSFEPQTEDHKSDEEPRAGWNWSAVSSFAQQLTTSFQSKGLTLVHEGVNVLEKIGRKTMSVLEETDPGFKYTKQLLRPATSHNRPNLSQIVREAYERQLASSQSEDGFEKCSPSKNSFAAQLESSRGLIHLEALELISDRAESQLHVSLSKSTQKLTLHTGLLESIWMVLQLEPEESSPSEDKPDGKDVTLTGSYLRPNNLPEEHVVLWSTFLKALEKLKWIYPTEHLLKLVTGLWDDIEHEKTETEAQSIFQSAIGALAKATSADLEYLHKMSECVLVQNQVQHTDFVSLASTAASFISASISLRSAMCGVYIKVIKSSHRTADDDPGLNLPSKASSRQLVASLMLECNNAEDYMKNAALLLIPVFQLAYVKSCLAD